MAWGRHNLSSIKDNDGSDGDDLSDGEYSEGNNKSSKKKKRPRSSLPPREGSRKSRRLLNVPSQNASGDIADKASNETTAERKERIRKERETLVAECREARQRAAIEVTNTGLAMAGNRKIQLPHTNTV